MGEIKMKSKKGGQFEREICKVLSLWWSDDKREDLFWRTAGSGARATVRRKQGKKTADATADVMATHESSKPLTRVCCFELKRGFSSKHKIVKNKKTKKQSVKKVAYGLEVLSILDKQPKHKEPVLIEWWKKLEYERKATKRRFSFLIFRRDAKQACIVMSYKTFEFLCKRNGVFDGRILSIHFSQLEKSSKIARSNESLCIIKLDDFLNWCQPKCFISMPRQLKRRKK
jgi:hypothetical protein